MRMEKERRWGRMVFRRRLPGRWHLTLPWPLNWFRYHGLYLDSPWVSITIHPLWGLLLLFLLTPSVWAGKGVGEDAAYAREMGFEQRFFYVASGNGEGQIEYICRAFPGTTGSDSTSASVWQVQRFTYDSSSRISTIAFAGDDDAFTQICANRTSLNYD